MNKEYFSYFNVQAHWFDLTDSVGVWPSTSFKFQGTFLQILILRIPEAVPSHLGVSSFLFTCLSSSSDGSFEALCPGPLCFILPRVWEEWSQLFSPCSEMASVHT